MNFTGNSDAGKRVELDSESQRLISPRDDVPLPVPTPLGRLWAALTRPLPLVQAASFDDPDLSAHSSAEAVSDVNSAESTSPVVAASIANVSETAARMWEALRLMHVVADSETANALNETGARIEHLIQGLAHQRAQLGEQSVLIRLLRQRLTVIADELVETRAVYSSPASFQPHEGDVQGHESASSRLPAIFSPELPIDLAVTGVPEFSLIVCLYRCIIAVPGVSSSMIESFEDGEVRFTVVLDEPVSDSSVLESLSTEFGKDIQLVAFDVSTPQLHFHLANAS
jgi:hypothetical protein